MQRIPSPRNNNGNPANSEELFLHLARSFQAMRRHVERTLRPAGLTLSEYMLMRTADAVPDVTASEVCDTLYLTAPTVAHTVASLEKKKWITRTPDPQDARRYHIKLTAAGRKIVTRCRNEIGERANAIGITPALVATTGKSLERFRRKVHQDEDAG